MAAEKGKRPGRHRTVTKYTVDAFETAGLPIDEVDSVHPALQRLGESSGEEFESFEMDVEDKADANIHEEDDVSVEAEVSDVDMGSGDEPGSEDEELEKELEADLGAGGRDTTHSCGIIRSVFHHSKFMRMKFAFGVSPCELLPLVHARENWTGTWDVTFPSKESLKRVRRSDSYGPGATFGVEPEFLRKEALEGWDWYYDDSIEFPFRKRQRMARLESDVAQDYMPLEKTEHTVILGPNGGETIYRLRLGESINFGEAWGDAKVTITKKTKQIPKKPGRPRKLPNSEKESDSGNPETVCETPKVGKIREGWILNMGNKIQALAWAPNCPGTQYLAVAVPILDRQKPASHDAEDNPKTPAFTPSPPYHAAIQIWAFESIEDNGLRRLDVNVKPRLRLLICTDVGDIKQLSWCPMSRDRQPVDETEDALNIGLLAGIWRDGTVKVLDVTLSKDAGDTELIKIEAPAFEAKPPQTLCTCLTWLSPSDIATGCANGFVAIWNISSKPDQKSSTMPYIYTPNQKSYIISIASAYPSYPHILTTSDVDGEGRMFSLLHPEVDTADFPRQRMGSSDITYSPFYRSFLSSNENGAIRILPVRRFFSGVNAMRHESLITSMAPSSHLHPSILVGTAGGDALAANPLRKLVSQRERIIQQTWFVHEWVPGKSQTHDADRNAGENVEHSGASKFHDGFKAEKPVLSINSTALDLTIFEEGTAVTALAWNPNQEFAGWACAGLGCGLIRVEDLSH